MSICWWWCCDTVRFPDFPFANSRLRETDGVRPRHLHSATRMKGTPVQCADNGRGAQRLLEGIPDGSSVVYSVGCSYGAGLSLVV